MESLELKNPFTNGKIVSVDTDPKGYHAIGGKRGSKEFVMSSSEIRRFVPCPRAWVTGWEDDETPAQIWGKVFEILALTPARFDERVAIRAETYTNNKGVESAWTLRSNTCKEWESEQIKAGRITISAKGKWSLEEAKAAVERLKDDDCIRTILGYSQFQVMATAEYKDRDTGIVVPVKSLFDIWPYEDADFYGRCIADLKTGRHVDEPVWRGEVKKRGYHIQGAWYLWVAQAASKDRTDFMHVLSENVKPYEPANGLLVDTYIREGQDFILGAMQFYCRCLASGKWPGYNYASKNYRGWTLIEPKTWMIGQTPDFPTGTEAEEQQEPTSDPNDLIP